MIWLNSYSSGIAKVQTKSRKWVGSKIFLLDWQTSYARKLSTTGWKFWEFLKNFFRLLNEKFFPFGQDRINKKLWILEKPEIWQFRLRKPWKNWNLKWLKIDPKTCKKHTPNDMFGISFKVLNTLLWAP